MVTKRKSVKNAKKISSTPDAAKAAPGVSAKASATSPVKAAPKSPAKGVEKEPAEVPAKAASADAAKSSAKRAVEGLAKGPAKGPAEGAAKAGGAKPKPSVASARKVAVPPAPAEASASTGARSKKAAKRKGAPGQSGRLEKQASAAAGTGEDAEAAPSREGAPRKHAGGRRRWPWCVALGVLAVLLVAAAGFSWDRWLRYDDARELQGEWQVDGTTRVIVIDGASIMLTDDVAYAYTIDPTAKTIEFTFGNMEGIWPLPLLGRSVAARGDGGVLLLRPVHAVRGYRLDVGRARALRAGAGPGAAGGGGGHHRSRARLARRCGAAA